MFVLDLFDHLGADVFEMYMLYALRVLFKNGHIILAAVSEMTRVEQQAEKLGVGVLHHSVYFGFRLNNGAHVVVESERDAHILCGLAELVKTVAEELPLVVVHDILCFENGLIRTLNGVALLGDTDYLRAHLFKESDVLYKVGFDLLVGLCEQEGGEPCVAYLHTSEVERFFENGGILGVFVAHFTACEACESHFGNALFEGIFRTEIGHIVICPCNGGDSEFYFVFVEHINISSLYLNFLLLICTLRRRTLYRKRKRFPRATTRHSRPSWSWAEP